MMQSGAADYFSQGKPSLVEWEQTNDTQTNENSAAAADIILLFYKVRLSGFIGAFSELSFSLSHAPERAKSTPANICCKGILWLLPGAYSHKYLSFLSTTLFPFVVAAYFALVSYAFVAVFRLCPCTPCTFRVCECLSLWLRLPSPPPRYLHFSDHHVLIVY